MPGAVALHDVIELISYVVWLDVDGFDVVSNEVAEFSSCLETSPGVTSSTGPLHRVAGYRLVNCHRLCLSLRCGMSLGATSSAESFIVPGDVGVHDVSDAISYVVWLDVDGLDVVRRIATEFRRAS